MNDIIDGIVAKIHEEFGSDYEIYTEQVKQGLKEPCFFITSINPNIDHELASRYSYNCKFAIDYFPKTDDVKNECNNVWFRLFDALEIIEVRDGNNENCKLRGTKINSTIADNILHFFVNYNHQFFKIKDNENSEKMEELETKFV